MVKKFQDLICWQKALDLTDLIYTETKELRDFIIRDQIRRAAISVMNNIAEGFGRFHSRDMLRFFEYSTSSCLEIENMTYIMERQKTLEIEKIMLIRNQSIETYKVTAGFSRSIKNT